MYRSLYVALILLGLSGCVSTGSVLMLPFPPSQESVDAAKKINSPVAFSGIRGERNSANGIDVDIIYQNISDKEIKYITFDVSFYNRVQDRVTDSIKGKANVYLKATGPIRSGATESDSVWPHVFYHANASKVVINSVDVIYMDGSEVSGLSVKGLPNSDGAVITKVY